jgi:hypothetical protein
VTVTNSAFDAVSGKTLFAPYNLLFHTATTPKTVQISGPATTNLSQMFTPISGVVSKNGLSISYLGLFNSPLKTQIFYEIEVAL